MEDKAYLEKLDRMIQLRGLTERTNRYYSSATQKLLNWCHENDIELSEITYEQAQDYVLYLKNVVRYAPKTVNSNISVIKFVFTYVLHRPMDRYFLPYAKVDKVEREILSPEEVAKFIRSMPDERGRAVVALLYCCGLRSCEVAALRYTDISRARKTLTVQAAKNRRGRTIPLNDTALDYLTKYWFACGRPTEWLFPGSKPGEHISRDMIGKMVKNHLQDLGWEQRKITSHTFRHCLGTHMYEAGCDLLYIQKFLGHNAISSTLVYITLKPSVLFENPLDTLKGAQK